MYVDIKAYQIRWHNPKSKNNRLNTPRLNSNRTEVYLRLPKIILGQTEEKRREEIYHAIREELQPNKPLPAGLPFDFKYEILNPVFDEGGEDDSKPIELNRQTNLREYGAEIDTPAWKKSLRRDNL